MFGIHKNKNGRKKGRTSRTEDIKAEEDAIVCLPIGRTGASRIEEELLAASSAERDVQSWRVFKIIGELVAGFELLRDYDLAATIFGSSRCGAGDQVYRSAEELGGRLAHEGFAVITGGASGVMNAANKGAKEAGGESVGLNIKLPAGQQANGNTTSSLEFRYFFTRKVMLAFASEVYIFFPGGFGTLDEFFEIITLVQTKKIKPIPIILMGRAYWEPLLAWFEHTVKDSYGAIDDGDMKLYDLVDSVDEAMALVKKKVKL